MNLEGRLTSLLAFAALALFVALNWVGMVAAPPLAATAAAVALIVAATAASLAVADRGGLSPLPRRLLLIVAVGLATVAALGIVGLPLRLFAPAGWGELLESVDLGLAGIGDGVSYPYDGPNEWSRLITLLAAPLIVAVAAVLTFWRPAPAGGAPNRRLAGLATLLGAYAMAATIYDPELPFLRGALLCLLIVAWLWLPVVHHRREWALGGVLVALGIAAAFPLTAAYGDGEGALDYHSWDWGSGGGSSFDWEHSYGPIDWERTGETVFIVNSERPNYWKASVLDRFNGTNWVRSNVDRGPSELPASVEPGPAELNPEWATRVQVTIAALRSDLIIGPGTARNVVSGVVAYPSGDETVVRALEPLEEGDAYEMRAYAPDPTVAQMRAAGSGYAEGLSRFTEIDLPGASGLPGFGVRTLGIGEGRAPEAEAALERSSYSRMYSLARDLGAGAPTAFDAVKAIEGHLYSNYTYSENPPERANPLSSFLFEDRIGYCQQFSGAMALMVRMLGIPARVATGFSPGLPDRSGSRFRVRDLDAHSWVEVYFSGIGWVPFDPTPPDSPAELQAGGDISATAAAGALASLLALGPGLDGLRGGGAVDGSARTPEGEAAALAAEGGREDGALPLGIVTGALLLLALGLGLSMAIRRARAERLSGDERCEVRVRELERALGSLGWGGAEGRTLLEVEERVRSRTEPAAAAYVARLRAQRFSPGHATAEPSPGQRRALRRRLSEGRGAMARLRALVVIPPGAPRV